jgi:hypothetical protein
VLQAAGELVHLTTRNIFSGHNFCIFAQSKFMNWIPLKSEEQITEIIKKSHEKAQVIFKHSTRCSISSMAKGRLDRSAAPDNVEFYFLDLIANRDISNKFHLHLVFIMKVRKSY